MIEDNSGPFPYETMATISISAWNYLFPPYYIVKSYVRNITGKTEHTVWMDDVAVTLNKILMLCNGIYFPSITQKEEKRVIIL